jgi:uncharacterized UBP type Zn finger protein
MEEKKIKNSGENSTELVSSIFGLNNVNANCYFNSFVQALLSCKSLFKIVQDVKDDSELNKTITGRTFIHTLRISLGNDQTQQPNISINLLEALKKDISERCINTDYGKRQESASEGLVLLLDMMEDPKKDKKNVSDVTELFRYWYDVEFFCNKCKKVVSVQSDTNVFLTLFFMDYYKSFPKTPEEFSEAIRQHISNTDKDYICPECKTRTDGIRIHTLKKCPEIFVCIYMLYSTEQRKARYFPHTMKFPGFNSSYHNYNLVAQIEHSGDLNGGHYICRAMRKNGKAYLFNDNSTPVETTFSPSSSTYMLFYQKQ